MGFLDKVKGLFTPTGQAPRYPYQGQPIVIRNEFPPKSVIQQKLPLNIREKQELARDELKRVSSKIDAEIDKLHINRGKDRYVTSVKDIDKLPGTTRIDLPGTLVRERGSRGGTRIIYPPEVQNPVMRDPVLMTEELPGYEDVPIQVVPPGAGGGPGGPQLPPPVIPDEPYDPYDPPDDPEDPGDPGIPEYPTYQPQTVLDYFRPIPTGTNPAGWERERYWEQDEERRQRKAEAERMRMERAVEKVYPIKEKTIMVIDRPYTEDENVKTFGDIFGYFGKKLTLKEEERIAAKVKEFEEAGIVYAVDESGQPISVAFPKPEERTEEFQKAIVTKPFVFKEGKLALFEGGIWEGIKYRTGGVLQSSFFKPSKTPRESLIKATETAAYGTLVVGAATMPGVSLPNYVGAGTQTLFRVLGLKELVEGGKKLYGAQVGTEFYTPAQQADIFGSSLLGGAIAGEGAVSLTKGVIGFTRGVSKFSKVEAPSLSGAPMRNRAELVIEDINTGKYLIVKDKSSGNWMNAGGDMRKGSAVKNIIREAKEELGITIKAKDLEKLERISGTERRFVYRYKVDKDKITLTPASDVVDYKWITAPKIYTGGSILNPVGRPQTFGQALKGEIVRSDTLNVLSRVKQVDKVNKEIAALSKTGKAEELAKAKEWFMGRYGEVPKIYTPNEILKEYKLAELGIVKTDVTLFKAQEAFIRRGDPTYLTKRIPARSEMSFWQKAKGKKPGTFEKFQETPPIVVGFGSRYDIPVTTALKFTGRTGPLISGRATEMRTFEPGKFAIEKTKIRRGGFFYFQPPVTPDLLSPGYLGFSYLGILKKGGYGKYALGFNVGQRKPVILWLGGGETRISKKASDTVIGLTSKAKRFRLTDKKPSSSELEFGLAPGRKEKAYFEFVGGEEAAFLKGPFKVKRIKFVTSKEKDVLSQSEINKLLRNIDKKSALEQTRIYNKIKKQTGIDYRLPIQQSRITPFISSYGPGKPSKYNLVSSSSYFLPKGPTYRAPKSSTYRIPKSSTYRAPKGSTYRIPGGSSYIPSPPTYKIPGGSSYVPPLPPPYTPTPTTTYVPPPPPPVRILPPTRIIPKVSSGPIGFKREVKGKKLVPYYYTEVRRRGNWKRLAGAAPRSEALRKGVSYTTTTLGTSFRLVKSGKKGIERDTMFRVSSKVFRAPKIRGKELVGSDIFIQRGGREVSFVPGARLATRGEKIEFIKARKASKVKLWR